MDAYTLKMISYLMIGLSFSLVLILIYFAFDHSISLETRFKNFGLLILNSIASLTITSLDENTLAFLPNIFQYIIVIILCAIVLGTLVEQLKNYFYIR